jgi:PAS domain S-box-containing protein
MTADDDKAQQVENLLETPNLVDALESEPFRRFLDQVPVALVVAKVEDSECIVYVNPEFEKLSGQSAAEVEGQPWSVLRGRETEKDGDRPLGSAITEGSDRVGAFMIPHPGADAVIVDVYSNAIEDDDGTAVFRLAALVPAHGGADGGREELERQLREKDTALREIQHRVRNNLQMIAALIRYEARTARGEDAKAPFDEIAGRIEALQLLYKSLGEENCGQEVDLGAYLSLIASAVMSAHAREGVRLDLKVDACPVSVDIAMPTGLVVNELMTNALKHAFNGREGGVISLRCLAGDSSCRVEIADDGNGLPEGVEWPKRGKLGELIVRSLLQNAKATLNVDSRPGRGLQVAIAFARAAAASEPRPAEAQRASAET